MTVRIGTSGFLYEHWRGRFYPPSARGSELEWYADRFDTVELNVTFYRMPSSAIVPLLGGTGAGGLLVRGQGEPVSDAHQAFTRAA